MTFHTDQKSGTSIAATQPETPYTASNMCTTDCSSGECVASAIDGPTPKENVSRWTKFDWTGSQWSRSTSWNWDCLLPEGPSARSGELGDQLVPQSDGSLAGAFQTTISSGACQGTVSIPLPPYPCNYRTGRCRGRRVGGGTPTRNSATSRQRAKSADLPTISSSRSVVRIGNSRPTLIIVVVPVGQLPSTVVGAILGATTSTGGIISARRSAAPTLRLRAAPT